MVNKNQQVTLGKEKKTIADTKREEVVTIKGNGFLQSLVIRWTHASQDVSNCEIIIDLGNEGSFTTKFQDLNDAGMISVHPAQDLFILKKDDVNYVYAIGSTPRNPFEFSKYLKITLVNKTLQIYPANHRLRKSTLFDLFADPSFKK